MCDVGKININRKTKATAVACQDTQQSNQCLISGVNSLQSILLITRQKKRLPGHAFIIVQQKG